MITVKKPEACTGCSICEMACSFHHIRKFSRSYSSIRVCKNLLYPENNFQISISVQNPDWDPFCDLCDNEDSPLCVQLCPESVLEIERR